MEIYDVIFHDLESFGKEVFKMAMKKFWVFIWEVLKCPKMDATQCRIKYCIYCAYVNFTICKVKHSPPNNHKI